MLILRTLVFGSVMATRLRAYPTHHRRHAAGRARISLSGAPRLERQGWIAAKWEPAGKDLKREFKYYRLTSAGKKQLLAEESRWKQMTGAIARIMWPAEES